MGKLNPGEGITLSQKEISVKPLRGYALLTLTFFTMDKEIEPPLDPLPFTNAL